MSTRVTNIMIDLEVMTDPEVMNELEVTIGQLLMTDLMFRRTMLSYLDLPITILGM